MNKLQLCFFALPFFLSACQSKDGKYLVYKSDVKDIITTNLDQDLIGKYSKEQYQITFDDKYAKMTNVETKQSIVLAIEPKNIPDADVYDIVTMEGTDSVSVEYNLKVTQQDMIFNVFAKRKGSKPFGDEASVDFYLAKSND